MSNIKWLLNFFIPNYLILKAVELVKKMLSISDNFDTNFVLKSGKTEPLFRLLWSHSAPVENSDLFIITCC